MLHHARLTLVARRAHSNHQKEVLERSHEELDKYPECKSTQCKSIACAIDGSAPANARRMDALRGDMLGSVGMVLDGMVSEPNASLSNGQCDRAG